MRRSTDFEIGGDIETDMRPGETAAAHIATILVAAAQREVDPRQIIFALGAEAADVAPAEPFALADAPERAQIGIAIKKLAADPIETVPADIADERIGLDAERSDRQVDFAEAKSGAFVGKVPARGANAKIRRTHGLRIRRR